MKIGSIVAIVAGVIIALVSAVYILLSKKNQNNGTSER